MVLLDILWQDCINFWADEPKSVLTFFFLEESNPYRSLCALLQSGNDSNKHILFYINKAKTPFNKIQGHDRLCINEDGKLGSHKNIGEIAKLCNMNI